MHITAGAGLQVTRTALQTPACKVLFTSKDDKNSVTKVLEAVREWLPNKQGQGEVYVMMVVGVPNVGKSTFINALKQHAHKQGLLRADRVSQLTVGPLPGVTKQVLGFKVLPLTQTSAVHSSLRSPTARRQGHAAVISLT